MRRLSAVRERIDGPPRVSILPRRAHSEPIFSARVGRRNTLPANPVGGSSLYVSDMSFVSVLAKLPTLEAHNVSRLNTHAQIATKDVHRCALRELLRELLARVWAPPH